MTFNSNLLQSCLGRAREIELTRSTSYSKILQSESAGYFPKVWGEPKWIQYLGQGVQVPRQSKVHWR